MKAKATISFLYQETNRFLSLAIIFFLIACNDHPGSPFGFTQGRFPIEVQLRDLQVRAEEKVLTGKNQECAPCHKIAYQNWSQSRHRVAYTNELFLEEHSSKPSAWCLNCHAPFARPGANPVLSAQRLQIDDGISCNVCHVRNNRVMVSKLPPAKNARPAHDYMVQPEMASAKFCAPCHDFNFVPAAAPAEAGEKLRFAKQPMQETYAEWLRSGFSGTTCQQCHLLPGSNQSHRFSGGHDAKSLKEAIKLEAALKPDGRLTVRIFSIGIGHAFPTGDMFRTLRVYLSPNGRIWREIVLGKRFERNPHMQDAQRDPGQVLVTDTTIPAPAKGEFVAVREETLRWPEKTREIQYELYLDYTHPHSKLFGKLPMSLSGLTFATGRLRPHYRTE